MYLTFFILSIFAFIYGLVAKKVETTIISGPIIFVFFGFLLGPSVLGVISLGSGGELLSTFAELTLALVLFSDAASAKMSVILKSVRIPERLLLLGLPFTILLGVGLAILLFSQFSLIEAAIVAIVLAPTDAALGKAVVNNPKIPSKIRESLNIESGLNDGICVPFLLLCLALVNSSPDGSTIGSFFIKAIGIGVGVGVIISYLANLLISQSRKYNWLVASWEKVIIAALAFAIYALAEYLGGSGFIACFVGGLLFGVLVRDHKKDQIVAAEGIGDSFALVTWVLFGAAVAGMLKLDIELSYIIYGLLSLTLVRMPPVFVTLWKSGLDSKSKIFMGWFGPRGLASIVFLIMIQDSNLPNVEAVTTIIVLTIIMSVILHGVSANPYANWLSNRTNGD